MLKAELVPELIDHPANAMNIQGDAHDSMDQKVAWGIEARLVDHKVRSCAIRSLLWCHIMNKEICFRIVRPEDVSFTISLNDGDEIGFGSGSGGDMIQLPDPRNLQSSSSYCSCLCSLRGREGV
jgi:hypothetical protein